MSTAAEDSSEWAQFSFGLSTFQDSSVTPILKTSGGDSTRIFTNGDVVVLGMKLSPSPHWAGTIDNFCSPFERNARNFSFTYALSKDTCIVTNDLPAVGGNRPHHTSCRIVCERDGIIIFTVTKICVADTFLDSDVLLTMTLLLNSKSSSNPINFFEMDDEEREVRSLMELNRFQPNRIDPKKVSTLISFRKALKLDMDAAHELNKCSTIVSICVQNLHPTSLKIEDVVIHLPRSCRKNRVFRAQSPDPTDFSLELLPIGIFTATLCDQNSRLPIVIDPFEAHNLTYCLSLSDASSCFVGELVTPISIQFSLGIHMRSTVPFDHTIEKSSTDEKVTTTTLDLGTIYPDLFSDTPLAPELSFFDIEWTLGTTFCHSYSDKIHLETTSAPPSKTLPSSPRVFLPQCEIGFSSDCAFRLDITHAVLGTLRQPIQINFAITSTSQCGCCEVELAAIVR